MAAYCRYRQAGGLASVEELAALCDQAGEWGRACRAAWIEPRLHPTSGVDTPTLHAACGPDADCHLDVLDHRAMGEVQAQVQACATWVPTEAVHCVSHAVDRWRDGRPDAAAFTALAADPGPLPRELGLALAEAVVCDRLGTCAAGAPAVAAACAERLPALQQDRARGCRRVGAPGSRPGGAPRPGPSPASPAPDRAPGP